MSKTVFKLPSNQDVEIEFRDPTVSDCLDFSGIDPSLSERGATLFLNQLSSQESRAWTMQDRISAIWWIFCTTTNDTDLLFEYICGNCGKKHTAIIDLLSLDDEATSLLVPPYVDDEIIFSGERKKIRVYPFNGYVMEALEQDYLYLESMDQESLGYKKAQAQLKIKEIAYSFNFYSNDGEVDSNPANNLEEKLKAIYAMSRLSELPDLIASITAAQQFLKHGLNHDYIDGKLKLLSPEIDTGCEKGKEDVSNKIRLLIPFFSANFIPEI